jgi:hypothetical protein
MILRAYLGRLGVWVDNADAPSGFRLAESFNARPTNDYIDGFLFGGDAANHLRDVIDVGCWRMPRIRPGGPLA